MRKQKLKINKMRVRKTLLKRFKITKTGKIMRGQQMSGHRKFHKSKRQLRAHRSTKTLNLKQTRVLIKLIKS
jgi:ribosomal protein L35